MEAESVGALAPGGHLGVFESIQASLHLTCPQDEKLSSDFAGHKSPLRISVTNWRRSPCVRFILLCIIQCFYSHKSRCLDL